VRGRVLSAAENLRSIVLRAHAGFIAGAGKRRYNLPVSQLLPLFPLEAVLFPGAPLPLHIFEPRYKEMIGELLQQRSPFGVVRAVDKGIAELGCTAEILEVTKRYDDGRLDIVSEGRRRFEIVSLDQERSFLRGEVVFFDDDPGRPPADEVKRLLELHHQALTLLGAEEQGQPDESQISFQVAGVMPFDLDFKQTLLGMRTESQRVSALIEYYAGIMPNLQRAVKARKKVGGNGHV
jgi:Lon protease-like protein